MEIKKADSKGRVSGFEPGKYYSVVRDGLNIILNPLAEGGYTGTGNSLYGLVHKAVLNEGDTVIPADPALQALKEFIAKAEEVRKNAS